MVGVIGDPVAHSLSPLLHNAAFTELGLDWVSVGFRVPLGLAADAIRGAEALDIRGLSVTMPHKEAVAGLVGRLTPAAERVGAVNCVVFGAGSAGRPGPSQDAATSDAAARGAAQDGAVQVASHQDDAVQSAADREGGVEDGTGRPTRTGETLGDNTDGPGLVAALRRGSNFDPHGRHCMVIGAGGAARAAVAALADAGAAEVVVVNRTPERSRAAAALAGPVGRTGPPSDVSGCDLVVNATPIGMDVSSRVSGATAQTGAQTGQERWPVDPGLLGPGQTVVDLVYHPPLTPWLRAARDRGSVVSNGLGMLVHQAALQLAAWTGVEPPLEAMWAAVDPSDQAGGRV